MKNQIKKCLFKILFCLYKLKCKIKKQKEFIIFNTPIHGNIGDHAILYAEEEILKKFNINAFEITTYIEEEKLQYAIDKISKDATIAITGGGFIGSQWLLEENMVNKVFSTFSNHKIIIFPQTIFFKNDEQGNKELKKSIEIFDKVKSLYIFSREKRTYDFAKYTYKNANVILVPDIVLSLEHKNKNFDRKDVLICLRKDIEGIFTQENKEKICEILKDKKINYIETDTVVNYGINKFKRKKELLKKLDEFAKSKLIITDRLHGMIFATITNTPCIVFRNSNYKVEGVYQWIKDNDKNIILKDSIDEIENDIDNLLKINIVSKKEKYNFDKLYKILEE